MLIKKEHQWFILNVKAIPGEFQHALRIVDMDKRKIQNVVRKACAERRKITLLKDVKIRKLFEEKLIKLVELWGHFKDLVLMACNEVYGMMRGRRSKGDTW